MVARIILAAALGALAASLRGYDLSELPAYRPEGRIAGTLRNFGSSLGGMLAVWEQGFRRFQPDVAFADAFPKAGWGMAGLIAGTADLAPQDCAESVADRLAFYRTFGYSATAITVMTGGAGAEGGADGLVVYVNAANPLSRLTLAQLDGIFGEERDGGYLGFKWTLARGRSAAGDLRTWGGLGLGGPWAAREIHTFGRAPDPAADFFRERVLGGGDKWNPNYREFVPTGGRRMGDDDPEQLDGTAHMLEEIAADPAAIGWAVMDGPLPPGLKAVALARTADGPFVAPSLATLQDRSYPLTRSAYLFVNRPPGRALEPAVREFLRYILSREGQEAVEGRSADYLPLTAALAADQLKKTE